MTVLLGLIFSFTRRVPIKPTSFDDKALKTSHKPNPNPVFCYSSLLKWLYQIAFPAHQIRHVNIRQQSVSNDRHFALVQRKLRWVQFLLDFHQVLDLLPAERFRLLCKQDIKEVFMVVDPDLGGLVLFVHDHAVGDNNDEPPGVMEMG